MLKAQRFWSKSLKEKINRANEALKTKNFTELNYIVEDLIELLQDIDGNWKDRVAICFILEQMAEIDPLVDEIVDGLMKVLDGEQDPHVKEFAVWALGKIVEDSQSLDLIKFTMPTLVKFLNDDSDQVKTFASELHSRLNGFIKDKETIDDQIREYCDELTDLIEKKLSDMKKRCDVISRDALGLDYATAHRRQDEFVKKIEEFNTLNDKQEEEVIELENKLIGQMAAFKGESRGIIRDWRKSRGAKEDLIRRVHCIIRIQSKIWGIIEFINSRTSKEGIELDDITKLTKKTGRPYSETEVVEILQKLVDEEIVPNFMLEQIKNYQIKSGEISDDEDSNS